MLTRKETDRRMVGSIPASTGVSENPQSKRTD